MQTGFSFVILAIIVMAAFVGMNITGLHHIPLEQVIAVEGTSYHWSISQAVRTKTCVAPDGERVDAGHCWFHSRNQEWYWCRPRLVDKNTGRQISSSAVESEFEMLVSRSELGIMGVEFVRASEGRCVHYERKDVYR